MKKRGLSEGSYYPFVLSCKLKENNLVDSSNLFLRNKLGILTSKNQFEKIFEVAEVAIFS